VNGGWYYFHHVIRNICKCWVSLYIVDVVPAYVAGVLPCLCDLFSFRPSEATLVSSAWVADLDQIALCRLGLINATLTRVLYFASR